MTTTAAAVVGGAATLSGATTKFLHQPSSLSQLTPPNLSFLPHPFCCFLPYKSTPTPIIPRISKLDGSMGAEEMGGGVFFFDENNDEVMEEESDDDDETESSVDLLIRFCQSLFNKLSKRAKKASRSLLPSVISPHLVSFAVDGTLLLAALSFAKALLEVVCSLGSTVFAAIVFVRVVWAAISYFQSNGNTFNLGGSSFGSSSQPVS